ncbi:hypothetical protein [Nocardia tengchongensis]
MTNYVIGFLRRDVSGEQWRHDEELIHTLAEERDWSLVLVCYGDPGRPGAGVRRTILTAD